MAGPINLRVAALKEVTYDPSVFLNVETVDEAVRIILTPEDGMTSQQRWKIETPYLMGLMERNIELKGTVLDYGCGIGRLSKPLIEKYNCDVIGVDISPNMRALAASCVDRDNFVAIHPDMLWRLFGSGFLNTAIAVWTLQHCAEPQKDIRNISRSLALGGQLFVVNNIQRVVPVGGGRWADDSIDINTMLCANGFVCYSSGKIDDNTIAPKAFRDATFWAAYRRI